MDNNDQQLKKRFDELARKSYNQGIYLFTDFLSMPDAAIACDSAPAGYVTLSVAQTDARELWQDSATQKNSDMKRIFLLTLL